ncbi:Putative NAD-dependent epimerase/dehydratase [Mycobacteroides abscessus]|nr:Putative NAD-dependent epimerase/dehydratase [Mycobacteroides abscessus]
MRVFVTGASGFIGSAVVRELIDSGHTVTGLARSNSSAAALTAAGADVHRGSLDDLESLRAGAVAADGVAHLAFVHDFENYVEAVNADKRAIAAIGEALAGTERPFVVTSGLAGFGLGRPLTEEDAAAPESPRLSEEALNLADQGVRVSAVRLAPSVHGEGDHGFVPRLIEIARAKGVSATRATGPIDGPPCTALTPPTCSVLRWRTRPRVRGCTAWPRTASRYVTLPQSSAAI